MKGFYAFLVIFFIAICAVLFRNHANDIIAWIRTLGIIAPAFFLLLYCFATIAFFPTMILTITGGALFGPVLGVIFNLIGATCGAICAFCISRYFMKHRNTDKRNPKLQRLITGVENRGWQFVALLRIAPIIPFNIVNYGLGLTNIKLSHYTLSTFIFLIPTEIISTYCGYKGIHFLINSEKNYVHLVILSIILLSGCFFSIKWCLSKIQRSR